ncbi:putative FAD-linked oxidoreductase [Falsiruegeria litorea R37]|uniref:Putative FAD-linked oxidoreductase n=1 Tax=Falsiruegeria litorea R37 TaxID=1200284 RepID=A0A1Y5REZ0_9RHOB|nr:FAD-binding protein [Falsiruegeria litorea]SLN13086.1 putative FAD-linked oxidoreductase [Falsiruegeria litorea R37]
MRPETEGQLAEIVAGLNEPVRIVGGGTRGVTGPGAELSVAGLSGIELYEPGALTLVAKAGTPVAEIEAALAAEGQRLAFEPMDHRGVLGTTGEPTIGGVVAANVSGPRRVQAGACRDFLLGVRYVDGSGQVIKNGGRVMKNVTGYDLVKLMAGSWGTLGVLSEVSLKVLPKPETVATLVWHGCGWTAASKIFSDALTSPYEVSGAARLPEPKTDPNGVSRTLVRVEGFEDSVKYRVSKLLELFSDLKPDQVVSESEENQLLWRSVRDVTPFSGRSGNIWKTSIKPTDLLRVAGTWDFEHILDWGGGLIWTLAPEGVDLRAKLGKLDGHVSLVRAGMNDFEAFGRFHPEPVPLAAISAQLRQRFDPRGLFNPGLMG